MSRWKGNNDGCPHCGLTYGELRTKMNYKEVRMLLWVASGVQTEWKYKRRHTVLGLWWSIKQAMWKEHLLYCEYATMAKEAQEKYEDEFGELVDVVKKELGDDAPSAADADLSDVPF